MRFVTLCTLAVLFAAGCGGEQRAASDADGVFKLRLEPVADAACADPSCVLVEHVEWVSPERGRWRRQTEDGSGYRTTTVFARGRYANNDEVRIGSPAFVGLRPPPSLAALRERGEVAVGDSLELPCGETRCRFRVEELLTLAEAEERGLFAIAPTESSLLQRELSPGEPPSLPVQAYWFGPELAGRKAFTAIELRTDDGIVHITVYGDAEEIAAGKTHAYPGRGIPERELQVTSRPVTDRLVKREIAALKTSGSGRAIVLANGERVVAYRHALLTPSTLVSLGGASATDVDLRRMASALRPL